MFIALSLLITAIILYLFFRSFRIVGFCVGIIGLSVIWAIGFMAILGIKITLLTAMLPPLLIVIGIPNCVYMVNKYHTEYVRHGNKIKALQRMIQKWVTPRYSPISQLLQALPLSSLLPAGFWLSSD